MRTQPVALNFSGFMKNLIVLVGPMNNGMPLTNKRFPRRINALLKKKTIPTPVKQPPPTRQYKPYFLLPLRITLGRKDAGPPLPPLFPLTLLDRSLREWEEGG